MLVSPVQISAAPMPIRITAAASSEGPVPSFGQLVRNAIGDVSRLQDEARSAIEAYVRGEPVELHQVMAAAEEAQLALEILVEFRNRFVEAYRTLITVQ